MSTPAELAEQTTLGPAALAHLQRLMASWGMLADLCFGDLLLLVPTKGSDGDRFLVFGQMRPTTAQTLHHEDLVGTMVDETERPLVARSWRNQEIIEGELVVEARGERARMQCIPVRYDGEVVAVLTRHSPLTVGRRPGELERIYVETFERFARMIVRGEFPYEVDDAIPEESPRVGDGVLVLEATGRVQYASPNAVNAMHRMGIYSNVDGMRLDELGVEETAVQRAFFDGLPITEEVDRRKDVVVSIRCIPLKEDGEVSGALVLVRDVTDVRRRDRLLISKDATIREVHHRVKNNLQTISSLLRLQGRRLHPGEGRIALQEAERRIRSIALVHEILSREAGEQIDFNEIIDPLVRMAREGVLTPDRPVLFTVEGDAGELPAELATPLAVVLTELLQNAVEHAFPPELSRREQRVDVTLRNDGNEMVVVVKDNGVGLPDDFAVENTTSLGLSIVRDLVTGQLGGRIDMCTDGGTTVELHIPVAADRD
ncbi:MAG: PAS domain-containing sensor histidine kinase [Actinomycetota bacterium]|nr:PAS domain-containing sensor histidine kinase [Actinomycetota bacterium]